VLILLVIRLGADKQCENSSSLSRHRGAVAVQRDDRGGLYPDAADKHSRRRRDGVLGFLADGQRGVVAKRATCMQKGRLCASATVCALVRCSNGVWILKWSMPSAALIVASWAQIKPSRQSG